MSHVDVAIVGAGPAGSLAAARLAGGGARVALIDGSHPREKPCGGGITGRALALVADAVQFPDVPSVTIEAARFEHHARAVTVPLGDGTSSVRLAVVPRREFDEALLTRARAAGAHQWTTRVTDVTRAAPGWTLSTRDGKITADWVLGADGPNSLVRRRVSNPFSRGDLSIAAGYYAYGASSREITVAFVDNPAGYLWSFPRPDHLAIGACAQADSSSPAVLLQIASDWIGRHVSTGHVRLERYGWPIPSLRVPSLAREQPGGPGWLLLGDAAGMVDPITREGIFFALTSGNAAAASLLEGTDPARRYTQEVRETVYDELLRAARLKARFFQPRFMALLVSALARSSRIRAVMSDLVAGEQSYRGLRRRLLATLEVRLFRELFGW